MKLIKELRTCIRDVIAAELKIEGSYSDLRYTLDQCEEKRDRFRNELIDSDIALAQVINKIENQLKKSKA